MSGLRVLPLGVGDAFSAVYYSSCLALEADGAWLMVDCPHPIRKILREAGAAAGTAVDVPQFLGIALTHLHADHCSGLEGLGFYARFVDGRSLPLLAHPDVAARLWDGHLAGGMEWSVPGPGEALVRRQLADFFDLHLLDETRPVRLGPFAVECHKAVHSVPTTALRIRAGGRCLGYSADTSFDAGLLAWLAAADLVIHETSGGPLHTPYETLATLPAALRARMRLIHYPDDFDVEHSAIGPLRQGYWCEV
jgi:ribonuclease BN (tRNA processing enzyme)